MINGTYEHYLPRAQISPCWKSIESTEAKQLQEILERTKNGDFKELDNKILEFMEDDHFFRLTEGKFYEVVPGDYKEVRLKIQVKEGTINWYFADIGHDETTQEFRNQVFRTAALGHLLVDGACAKYYRGTNAMHVKRMHTSENEAKINHNHYRVHDNHVTPAQFKAHLEGFLKAQKAYDIENKFLSEAEVVELIAEYQDFDNQLDEKDSNLKTKRELFHEQEQLKWSELDKKELNKNKPIEEPCEAQEMIIPLNEKQISIETKSHRKEKILPRDWVTHLDVLDKSALDIIAKAGSEGQKSHKAHTRQLEGSSLPVLPNAYSRLGELFEQNANTSYPSLDEKQKIT
jgi:hypothetical protein